MLNAMLSLEDRAEFHFSFDWIGLPSEENEDTELPDDYESGEWSQNSDVGLLPANQEKEEEQQEAPTLTVIFRAEYAGHRGFSRTENCSYTSREEFMDSAMFVPMKLAARYDLEQKLKETAAAVALLSEPVA